MKIKFLFAVVSVFTGYNAILSMQVTTNAHVVKVIVDVDDVDYKALALSIEQHDMPEFFVKLTDLVLTDESLTALSNQNKTQLQAAESISAKTDALSFVVSDARYNIRAHRVIGDYLERYYVYEAAEMPELSAITPLSNSTMSVHHKLLLFKQLAQHINDHDVTSFAKQPNKHFLTDTDWIPLAVYNSACMQKLIEIQQASCSLMWLISAAYRERQAYINAHMCIKNFIRSARLQASQSLKSLLG